MIILLMFISPSAKALSLKLSNNISYSGSLDHSFSYNKTSRSEPVITNISALRLRLGTYLWRPWIATLNSNLAFSYTNRQNTNNSTGQNITGDVNFNAFPQSRFPFRGFFRKTNNQVDGDLTNQNLNSTAWGISQDYSIKATRLSLNYQHTFDQDDNSLATANNRSTEDTEDSLDLALSTRIGNHDASATSKFNFIERNEQFRSDNQMLHVLRHNYRPDTNLTVNNLFTYSDRSLEQIAGAQTSLKTIQFNSNTFWRPKTKKRLLVTANALLQGNGDTQNSDLGIFNSAGVAAQVNYQWSPFINLRAQANANKTDFGTKTVQRIGAEYTPADSLLLGFNHSYNLSVDAANNTGEIEPGNQELNLRAGHIFNRNFPTAIGLINMSATQRGATVLDSAGKIDRTLSHTFGMGWNNSNGNSTDTIRMTLSDTRRTSNVGDEFGLQQANLQLSRNHLMSRDSSFNGNITFQANRILENNDREGTVDLNSSVSVNYSHNRLFKVDRLRLISELRYLSNSLFQAINSDGLNDENQNDAFWQNRLSYGIGRLDFRLTTNIGQSNGEFNNFVLLQVRRNFGR